MITYKNIIITTFKILTIITHTIGFIGYDCTSPKINITAFNTLNIEFCTPPILTDIKKVPIIKLLQKKEIQTIKYQACYIIADYLITRCSSFDDAQAVKNGYYTEIIQTGPQNCAQIHRRLSYTNSQGDTIQNLIINQTTYASLTIAGQTDEIGNCKGATFKTERYTWDYVIVQAKYKIYISDGVGIANYRDDSIILPTGTRLKLSQSYGMDTHKGEVIWEMDKNLDCTTNDYDTIYEGPASLVISKSYSTNNIETKTYIVETDKIAFALKSISKTFACNIPVVQTEHPRLVILTDIDFISYFHTKPISTYNTDLMAYINTKFVYVENILKSTITSMYIDLVNKQCNLERKILLQKLSLASYSLSEFAYIMGEGPGYTAVKSGEIVNLLKCKPVNVEVIKTEACFQELPVTLNNQTFYLAPKTHILQKYGTEIDCNDILPAAFFMEGVWFSMSPSYREIKTPQTLAPETTWSWTYKSPENLMNAGLYTKEMINALQKHLLFPQEVDAAQSNIVRQSMGYSTIDQGIKIKSFIDENIIGKMVEEKLNKMWGWFVGFGNLISGLLGIFCIWKILIICLNTILNISILYETFGFSLKILAGIFSSLTHYVMHKAHRNKYNKLNTDDTQETNEQNTTIKNKNTNNRRTISLNTL